jgi:predicted MPP superfamily phosphohydrolase
MNLAMFLAVWLVAAVGHAAVWVHVNNWLHSVRPHGWWIRLLRLACHAINAGGIVAFGALFGPKLATSGDWLGLSPPLLVYIGICLLLALGYVPVMLYGRWTRPLPVQQTAIWCSQIDVVKQLGYRPLGQGWRSVIARLPGNEIFHVDITERELTLPALPAEWDGLNLLHLSDLHLCGCPGREFFETIMNRLAEQPADLLLITGDLVDDDHHYQWLGPLLGRLRWRYGAYAVLGNHDSWFDVELIKKELARLQIACIGGAWRQVDLRGKPLILIGNEAPWSGGPPDLSALPQDGFRLCLSHSPDQFGWAVSSGIDLMVAGHAHGGQIRLPGIGSIFVPSRYSGRYDCGLFYRSPTLLFVTRGLSGSTPVRYNCRPEVARLVLRAGLA